MNERVVRVLTYRYAGLMAVLLLLCIVGFQLFQHLARQVETATALADASARQRMQVQNVALLVERLGSRREGEATPAKDAAFLSALTRSVATAASYHETLRRLLREGALSERLATQVASLYLGEEAKLGAGIANFLERASRLTGGPLSAFGPANADFAYLAGAAPGELVAGLDAATRRIEEESSRLAAMRENIERAFLFVILTVVGGSAIIFLRPMAGLRSSMAEKTRAEAELRRDWERYALATKAANDGLWDWNLEKNEVYFSPRMAEIAGIEPSARGLKPREIFSMVHPEDAERFRKTLRAYMNGKTDLFSCEFRIAESRVGERWVLERGVGLRDERGKVYRMAGSVSDITERRRAEKAVHLRLVEQEIVAEISHLANEPIPLDEILRRTLSIVLSRHKFGMLGRGAVFLVDAANGDLEMRAQVNLAKPLLESCARVKPGHCMCGRAAEARDVIFSNEVDDRHEVTYDGIQPHGHYCAPIESGGQVLGVLNLYVPAGHQWDAEEEQFITTVADNLAGAILRRRAVDDLANSERRFRSVAETASDALVAVDGKGRVLSWNHRAREMFGYSENEMLGRPLTLIIPHRHRDGHAAGLQRLTAGGEPHLLGKPVEMHALRNDGQEFPVELSIGHWTAGGETFFSGIIRDITERKAAEQRLRELSQAVEQSPASVFIADRQGAIQYVNHRYAKVTGYRPEDVMGRVPDILRPGGTEDDLHEKVWKALEAGREWRGEFRTRRKDGDVYWEFGSISPVRGDDGLVTHFLATMEDITLRKEYEERLLHQATYDALTELPNRVLALDRLSQAIARAQRNSTCVALMFIDLDHFKKINDTLGHAAGDSLLREAARRLKECLRDSDTVARLGGDEFMVVLPDLEEPLDSEMVAQKIIDACAGAFDIEGREVFVTASLGITVYPDDEISPQLLMRNADAAMYHAKEDGRNAFRFFTAEMNEQAMEHLRMEENLRHAIDRGEMMLHFQPLVDNISKEIIGAEALIRWESPGLGAVPPDRLIPLAEETGLIVPIGEWVLRTACREAAKWNHGGGRPITVAVNVSGRQFQKNQFVKTVRDALAETGLAAHCLELEITEGVLLEDSDETKAIIEELSAMGVRFSIDDFGTGYSSLSYLKRYPFHTLKIDRSFMQDVTNSENAASLVQSIVAMARSMNLTVIGEGIETSEQHQFLHGLGCEMAQGWLFGKPVPPDHFAALLRR